MELDLEKVLREHWFGTQALELGLVDEIKTSDDLIVAASQRKISTRLALRSQENASRKFLVAQRKPSIVYYLN